MRSIPEIYRPIHIFLETFSPELTLIGVVLAVIALLPGVSQLLAKPERPIIVLSYEYYILPEALSCPVIERRSLWDRFWLSFSLIISRSAIFSSVKFSICSS